MSSKVKVRNYYEFLNKNLIYFQIFFFLNIVKNKMVKLSHFNQFKTYYKYIFIAKNFVNC